MSIKILDASILLTGTDAQKNAFCEALVDGFSNQGMVKLVNHGLPNSKIQGIFDWSKRFFQIPNDIKHSIAHPPRANPNRGWVCAGQEKSTAITDFEKGVRNQMDSVFDLKESFDTGAPNDPLYDNVWPPEPSLPGFRDFMEEFYAGCQDLHIGLLKALQAGFLARGIAIDLLTPCSGNVSEMRLNYYPPIDISDIRSGTKTRISPHTDFGTMTLLFQDSVGGLEVEDQSTPGSYIPVPSNSPYEILVNIGDSLQRMTNDVLTSVSHRVTIPIGEREKDVGILPERYSVAYFAKVGRGVSLKPMAQFVGEDGEEKYPDITAFEWNQIKLQKIYG